MRRVFMSFVLAAAMMLGATGAMAANTDFPNYDEGDVVIPSHTFIDGNALHNIRLHYRSIGIPRRDSSGQVSNAVIMLHGTGGNGGTFLAPNYADALFAPGKPLDANKYYIIFPDSIGHGGSSKPSDGLGPAFPKYDYSDMVALQRQLLQTLEVTHLRLVMGMSMGGMNVFEWATTYPDYADAYMAFACLPVAMSGRNRIWRKMAIDAIERDPAYKDGKYDKEPTLGLKGALDLLLIHGSAAKAMQAQFPTREKADERAAQRYANIDHLDANDLIYALDASRNYDPQPKLKNITRPFTLVNSADDFSNPPELGIAEKIMPTLPKGRFYLIPASEKTRGHGTFSQPQYWVQELVRLLKESAR